MNLHMARYLAEEIPGTGAVCHNSGPAGVSAVNPVFPAEDPHTKNLLKSP